MPNKKILVCMGTRPEVIKMAPVVEAIQTYTGLKPIVLMTGQHREMAKRVANIFGLQTRRNLKVMTPNQTLAG